MGQNQALIPNGSLSVTATATGAIAGSTPQWIDVALGLEVHRAIADICQAFGIGRDAQYTSTNQPAQKLVFGAVSLVRGLTFAQQGVQRGFSVVLANTP